MGLDMYLKSTGNNYRRVRELAKVRAKEFYDFSHSLHTSSEKYSELNALVGDAATKIDFSKISKEQRDLIAGFKRELIRKAHSLEGILRKNMTYAYLIKEEENDPVETIGYWGKEWSLHQYIVANFGDKDHDNLTEVYLDEAAIERVIEHYKDNEMYCEPFRLALKIVKGGGVVFYMAWY